MSLESLELLFPNKDQFDRLIAAVASQGDSSILDAEFGAVLDGTNTTHTFALWWPLSGSGSDTRYQRLARWFHMLALAWADKQYTLRYADPTVSGDPSMTPMDDLTGKSAAQLCTEATTPVADWADEDPMTWYIRANALSLTDGTMNVLAVEGVDDSFDITGANAPVYTFCLALWLREWDEGSYCYKSWATVNRGGYHPYGGDVAPDGSKRVMTWRPTFPGGYDANGKLGSGAGQKPVTRVSAAAAISLARGVDAYEGLWNDADTIWALDMWQLRHFNLENSDICEGCTNYDYQYRAAVAEEGVTRVLLTAANAANILEGSTVLVGDNESASAPDRGNAAAYNKCDHVKVLRKETVTVSGTDYIALVLGISTAINVTETTWVSTAPWIAGNTEQLPDHKDGCTNSLTAGRTPIRVQGVELMDGAYAIGLDPLYNVTNFASGKGDYAVYECRDSVNLASSVTANYIDTGITYEQMPQGWQYVKAFVRTKLAVLFPRLISGDSSHWYKSAFYGSHSAGVRCPWRFASLNSGVAAGLACASGYPTPSDAGWGGRPRLSGSGKKRGEWAA